MIRLIIDGQEADLLNDEFTWNMQCADFFSFDTRQFSCSDVMYLPMSTNNNEIFDYAGMVGSVSGRPQRAYEEVEVLVEGVPIVRHARGYLMGVYNDTYKFAFHEETKDVYHWLNLYKLSDIIGNKLNHSKNADVITSTSQTYALETIRDREDNYNIGYLYPVAEYGGDTLIDGAYNFYYCPPAIHVMWIFKEVMRMSGQRFEGSFFDSKMFKTLFITTSQVLNTGEPKGVLVSFKGDSNTYKGGDSSKRINNNSIESYMEINNPRNPSQIFKKREKTPFYTMPLDSFGSWDLNLSGIVQGGSDPDRGITYVEIYKNDDINPICSTENGVGGYITEWEYAAGRQGVTGGWAFTIKIPDYLSAGDRLYVRLRYINKKTRGTVPEGNIGAYRIDFKIEQTSLQNVNKMVSDLSMLDLFKELMIMFGLTAMKLDIDDPVQHFFTVDERLNEAPLIDWTDQFVRVTNLEFHVPTASYARRNHFLYKKYDEQENKQFGADGVMVINDDLLAFKKEREGKFFAGIDIEKSKKLQYDSNVLEEFHFWEKEVKEEGGGVKISYKPKDNRFHIFNVTADELLFQDKGTIKGDDININDFYLIPCHSSFLNLRWNKLIESYYGNFNNVLNHMRVYTCEMNLTALDIHQFNFFKRIYIMQLGGIFLPNKITFKAHGLAVVELIKIEPIE
jgi:hypothetical protein|nr:MAG TPA: hypothetical protein [Caudoviricetes sp.]DAP89626.1 MAG TPA: hypothetical protein [Caudoviricetes sp.]